MSHNDTMVIIKNRPHKATPESFPDQSAVTLNIRVKVKSHVQYSMACMVSYTYQLFGKLCQHCKGGELVAKAFGVRWVGW